MTEKKIYFIAPYPFNAAPSQRFRFEQYFTFLEQEGYEVKLFPFLDEKTWKTLYSEGNELQKIKGVLGSFLKRFFLLFSLRKADYIFIQSLHSRNDLSPPHALAGGAHRHTSSGAAPSITARPQG